MSILKVYLNWANSVLSEAGKYVDGVAAVQDGHVLCDLIDILAPEAGLVDKVQKSNSAEVPRQQWIETALEHMRAHGIKYTFTVQDILDGDIKSLLDVLWLIILNYSLHNIGQNAYQRSVGIGKKHLMEWCEQQLQTNFDQRNTFGFNLCQDDWFSKLLQKFTGVTTAQDQDRVTALSQLLDTVEDSFSISRDILSASDILDGTVDEHTLMIFVALLRRRVGDLQSLTAFFRLKKPQGGMSMEIMEDKKRSRSSSPATRFKVYPGGDESYSSETNLFKADETRRLPTDSQYLFKPMTVGRSPHRSPDPSANKKNSSTEELSDWVSSSSLVSVHSDRNVKSHSINGSSDGDSILRETISQQVYEHMPKSENEDEKDEDTRAERDVERNHESESMSSARRESKRKQMSSDRVDGEIRIKRPKDYFLQWEDTIDRLSQEPLSDVQLSTLSQSDIDLDVRSRSSSRGSRSRSFESQLTIQRSSLERERNIDSASKVTSRSHPDLRRQTHVEMRNGDRSCDHNNGAISTASGLEVLSHTSIQDLQSHPMFPNLKSLLSSIDPQELEAINQSGQPADVLTLLDAIKKARLAVDDSMPKDNSRNGQTEAKQIDSANIPVDRSGSSPDGSSRRQVRDLSDSPSGRKSTTNRQQSPLQRHSGRYSSYSPRMTSPRLQGPLQESPDSLTHLPRREAWERQRSRNTGNVTFDASRIDSLAQARFIEVLCKEIEELKYRMDSMETTDEEGHQSPRHRSPRLDKDIASSHTTGQKIEPLSRFSDIHEQNGQLVFESSRSRSLSPEVTRPRSPEMPRRIPVYTEEEREMRQANGQNRSRSLSPTFDRQEVPERDQFSRQEYYQGGFTGRPSSSPPRYENMVRDSHQYRYSRSTSPQRPQSPLRRYMGWNRARSTSPEIPRRRYSDMLSSGMYPGDETRSISLGYSSPVRSVTQEIWGNKLSTVDGLEPERQDRWKALIASRDLSDEDVIELKQALASCIVENDILQAKLRNAKADVSDKLFKTNDILDDCRRHLAKSQAENMELRSNYEHERQKSEELESRIHGLENTAFQARTDADHLRRELEEVNAALNKSLNEVKPVEELEKVNENLRVSLSKVERDNETLRREIDEMLVSQEKAQSTIKELRICLEEVRQERGQLFEEINDLHANNQKSKVADIMSHYTEKGACDAVDHELHRRSRSQPSSRNSSESRRVATSTGRSRRLSSEGATDRRSRIDQFSSHKQEKSHSSSRNHSRTSTWDNELEHSSTKLEMSGPLGETSSSRDTGYSTEDMMQSPTVPSSFREIYPHRNQYYRDKHREGLNFQARASPIPFEHYSELQDYPTKLTYPEYNSGDPFNRETDSYQRDGLYQRSMRSSYSYTDDYKEYESSQRVKEIVENILDSASSRYQQGSDNRLSQSMYEPRHSSQPRAAEDRLNLSYNAIYDKPNRTASPSFSRSILKSNKSQTTKTLRERSCSPVLQRYGRSHSPPTRLSPKKGSGDKTSSSRNIHSRTSTTRNHVKNVQDKAVPWKSPESSLQAGYTRAKSWYELQLKDNEYGSGETKDRLAELTEKLSQEPTVLNDAQRRYADHLIEKYTGQKVQPLETY